MSRTFEQWRDRVNCLVADYEAARRNYKQAKREWVEACDAEICVREAQQVCQVVAHTVQQRAHTRIASVVSRCLEAVFDEPYEFKIEFEQQRGRTWARLHFVRDELTVDPMSASGGGVVDVAAFALRLSCVLLSRPAVRRVLVMDEPFKFVSEGYRDRVRHMLLKLSDELRVQFILVTHIEELKCGTVIEL